MKANDWLHETVKKLGAAGISTSRLDALVLLEDALRKDRGWLLAHPHEIIAEPVLKALDEQVVRRAAHEPLAYIRGKSEFYGREFKVTPATLQPRPETETMIELFKSLDLPTEPTVADIGTGSGAIIITAKLERPSITALATEIQPDALEIARANARSHAADIAFYEGNLIEPIAGGNIDVILANLPYVPDGHTINAAAMQEPAVAIFGGEDGLELYRRLFGQLEALEQRPAYVLTESLPFQHKDLSNLATVHGYQLRTSEDFIQLFELS